MSPVIHTHGARGQDAEPPEEPGSTGWDRLLATAQDWTPGGSAETLLFTAAMAGTAIGLLVGAILEHAVLGAVVGCLTGSVAWPLLGITAYRRVRARRRRSETGRETRQHEPARRRHVA